MGTQKRFYLSVEIEKEKELLLVSYRFKDARVTKKTESCLN